MTLNLTIDSSELVYYVNQLLCHNFPVRAGQFSISQQSFDIALHRLEFCFERIHRKYYHDGINPSFDPFNSDHLSIFLWFLSNEVGFSQCDEPTAILLSHLNKRLHCLDLFFSVPMPDIFMLVHPVGSVFGSAKYSDYFVGYQNCTIGAHGNDYPVFDQGVICYSKTSVIGNCNVGKDVVFGANSFILNTNIPDCTTVVGSYPDHKLLPNSTSVKERIFSPKH